MKKDELVIAASKQFHCLKNKENWEGYAQAHQLPSYEEVRELFNSWRTFKQEVYKTIAKENKDHFFTPKYWDTYAKENNLPEAKHYRALFGDWKQALTIIHDGLEPEEIKKNYLIAIAKQYSEYFSSQKEWDEFANEHHLPISATYKNHFESWNEVVEIVTGKKIVEKRYTKEAILSILAEHKKYLATQETWKKHAQDHQLPSINTFVKHFGSFNEVKRLLSLDKIQQRVFSKEELWKIASEHKKMFHLAFWNFYSTTYHLPTETAFINHFGSFKAVQDLLGVKEGEYSEEAICLMEETIDKKKRVLQDLINQNQEVIEQIYPYWKVLDSKMKWEQFSNEQDYPSYNELLSLFDSKKQLKQSLFLYIALENKLQFNNVEWNDFATANQLPLKSNYYNLFSSWEWIQRMVWGDIKESKKSYLLRKANENIEHFTTYKNWNDFASNQSLPSASQYEFYFGSWNEVKKALGLKLNRASSVG